MYDENKKHRIFLIHRLIGLAFVPKVEGKNQINHKNGIKTDNRIENLEWCTNAENVKHSFKIGIQSHVGSRHTLTKFSENNVLKIRGLYDQGKSCRELAGIFDVRYNVIYNIVKRATWKHI